MALSPELGTERDVVLPGGRLRYRDRGGDGASAGARAGASAGSGADATAGSGDGSHPVVLLVHGLLVNGDLWDKVVPRLVAEGFRCITPDLPLGAHELPMPDDADVSPPGVATLLAQLLDELDVRDVTVVANDTGGAITQILMTSYPDRIGRVVLTPSDAFESFFPPLFAPLPKLARVPGGIWTLVQLMRLRPLQRLPIAFGWVTKRPVPQAMVDAWLAPTRRHAAIRADLTRFLRGVHRRHTLAAAQRFATFTKPVLIAWASEDRIFSPDLGQRLADALPNATLVHVDDSYTFIPQDQPAVLAGHIVSFVGSHSSA